MTANLDNASDEPLVRRTFLGALELPTRQERQDFLAEACGGDLELRAKVEALLRSHREEQLPRTACRGGNWPFDRPCQE